MCILFGGDIKKIGKFRKEILSKNVKQRNLLKLVAIKLVAIKSMVTSVTTGTLVTK
jgi:hypothetical protein